MAYYVIVCEGTHPIMPIGKGPNFVGNWRDGKVITEAVPQPLVYTLDPDFPGSPKAMYYGESIPVVREDVIEAFRQTGVDNIQYFDAVLRDPSTEKEYRNYKAYNIVGLVACANMQTSELMGSSDSVMGDADFHSLVVDESKTQGLLLFRLAESVNAIIVHEKVKLAVENAGIPGFVFYEPGEWSG